MASLTLHFDSMSSHRLSRILTRVFLAALLTHALSSCIQRDSVNPTAGNAVALSWNAPTTNVDGSGLMDLAGYRIYYGTALGEYPHMVEVGDSAETRRVVANLPPATYYFVVTAYDAEGSESRHSNVAIKTIQ